MVCTCGEGPFSGSCCCGSVTNLKGGIHPDSIKSVSTDILLPESTPDRTHFSELLLGEPVHIISVQVALVAIVRDSAIGSEEKQLQAPATAADSRIRASIPASVSLYTSPGYLNQTTTRTYGGFNPPDSIEQDREYFTTCAVTSYSPTWSSGEDLFGYFADGGVFVEFTSPDNDMGARVVMNYVPRLQFPPAYHDPLDVMQHYWKCSRGEEEFLEGFYSGTSHEIISEGSSGSFVTPIESSFSGATNPFSPITSVHTQATWWPV